MIIKFLLLLIVFFAVPFGVFSTTYYVSPIGNDTNNGNEATPWKTIQKAADISIAGDIVNVSAGTYNEIVKMNRSGINNDNLIKFITDGEVLIKNFYINGNYIEVSGFTLTPTDCVGSWDGAIHISGSNNLIHNNLIKNSTHQGIVLTATTNSNIVRDNIVTRAQVNGLNINGNNHIVEGNDISDISNHTGSCSLWNEANAVEFHGSGTVFRKNKIHNFIRSHINGNAHVDAFQTHTASGKIAGKNIIFEQNNIFMGNDSTGLIEGEITDTQGFHAFMIEGSKTDTNNWASNIVIKNNIIESRHGLNIGGGGGNVSNLKIHNNVWRGDVNSTTAWPTGVNMSGVIEFEIFNNIFVDFMNSHISVKNNSTGGKTGYNIFWNSNNNDPKFENYSLQVGDKKINPKFINNFSDYHLSVDSQAINSGTVLSNVTIDKDNISRPQGSGYDIGAYEYIGSINPTSSPSSTPFPPTPTPTPLPIPGDIDHNKVVDMNDYNILLTNFGKIGGNQADVNNSGKVDIYDYNFVIKNLGMRQ